MSIKSIRDIDIRGKRIFFRFDFNVPLDDKGSIKDDTRIIRALPTIRYAIDHGAKSILTSHLGRPKGERRPEMSLMPVAKRLGELLGRQVTFVDDCIGEKVTRAVESMKDGDVILLENLRFYPGETKSDANFAGQLASIADIYVNDAFGTAHRAHASTVGVAGILREKAAGLLMKEELDHLTKAFANPTKPVVAIFGGAKVSDKLAVLENIIDKIEYILIGGGMANTFLQAKGYDMGSSKIEMDLLDTAKDILAKAKNHDSQIILPQDVVVSETIDGSSASETVLIEAIPSDQMALDIGPKTIAAFQDAIERGGTIIWNGPMGVFEVEAFSYGTMQIAKIVASSTAFSLIGGGDTIRAVTQAGVSDKISYISTGGGAFMEFMEGKELPGIAALEEK